MVNGEWLMMMLLVVVVSAVCCLSVLACRLSAYLGGRIKLNFPNEKDPPTMYSTVRYV